ncbi:hypothetical protein C8Q70DRAFT_1031792 [Cubamyces menziesii]|nr:hypothetical protein C8Q70DRAFT_1031792 [Cubamyces menziesii]
MISHMQYVNNSDRLCHLPFMGTELQLRTLSPLHRSLSMIPSQQNQRRAEKRDGDKAADPHQVPPFRPLTPPESPRRPLGKDPSQGEPKRTTCSGLEPDTHAAVHQLLTSSQTTLNHIQQIVRIVSDQTHAAAAFKTVLGAADEIERLEVEVQSHCEAQDAAIEKAKMDVREAVENQITQTLRPRVTQMVADAVGQVVEDCVQTALDSLIQRQMKDEIDRYRRRILEVKTMLADAETRRRNERHQREARSTAVQDVKTTPASAALTSVPATTPAPVATPAAATAPVPGTAAHEPHAASAPEVTPAVDAAVAPDNVPVPDTTPRPKTTPALWPTPTLSTATPALDPTPVSSPSSPCCLPATRHSPPACTQAAHSPGSHWNVQVSMGAMVLLAWIAVCATLGDGADAGVRMAFS